MAWINNTKEQSWFESPLSPAVMDKILILSTCIYEFDNARFVLHGVIQRTKNEIKFYLHNASQNGNTNNNRSISAVYGFNCRYAIDKHEKFSIIYSSKTAVRM